MSGRNRLTILVDAKNQASGQLRSIGSDVSSISESINGAFSMDGALGALGELSPMLGTVATAAAGVGVAVGGWQLAKGAMELGRLGAESLRAKEGFGELARDAGTSGSAMLDALQTASAGAINNQNLMISASRSMMLGVADSAGEMSALMAVAIDRGRKLGMDAQTSFNDLVTGLGRGSTEILDNLAIMIDSEKVYGDYAASIGKTAAALSAAEKKQALINTVVAEGRNLMREQGGAIGDAASSFERMDAALANSKAALGELFGPAVAVVAENIARAATGATEALQGMGEGIDLNGALGNIQALEGSIARQTDELIRSKEFLAQTVAGSAEYNAQLQVISESELQVTRTTRDLEAAKAAYFSLLQQLYPAQTQSAEAMNRTSIEAEGAARAQAFFSAQLAGQPALISQATASMDLLGASYTLLMERSAALEGTQGQLTGIASQMVDSLGASGAVELYAQMNAELQTQIANWQAVGYSAQAIQDILLPAYIGQLRESTVGSLNLAQASREAATELNRVQSSALGAANGLGQTTGMFGMAAAAANAMADQVAAAAARLDQFAASAAAGMASDLVSTKGAGAAITYYNAINSQIGAQTDKWKEQGYTVEQIEGVLLPGYVSGLRKATTGALNLGNATRSVGSAAAQVNQEFSNLESKVSGVISGALGDIGGINLDDMLPRQDSVSEDARRLADVAVNGFKSPWAEYFQNEYPAMWEEMNSGGDIQGAAAQMLRDFQDGLRPELIDKDRAKEIVKRAIIGDQNTKALVDEISKELANELGISMQEAKAAATGALGGGGILGDALGGAGGAGGGKMTITPVVDTTLLPTALSVPATVEWASPLPMPETKDLSVTVSGAVKFEPIDLADAQLPEMYTLPMTLNPTIDWQNVDTETPRTALTEKMVIRLVPFVDWLSADTETPRTALIEKMGLGLAAFVDWQNVDTETPRTALIEKMGLKLSAFVDWQNTDTATAATGLTEKMVVAVTPSINTSLTDVATSLTYLESELTPIVTPYINHLGIPPQSFVDASAFITEQLVAVVTPQIDTTSEGMVANTLVAGSNMAMGIMDGIIAYDIPGAIAFELSAGTGMYNAGGTNGQLFASGFMDFFGGNVPAHVVNVLFNLVWSKVQAENSKKAAK